jgi:hypothetical protein
MMQMAPMNDAMSMGVMPAQNMGMPPQMFPGQGQPKSTAPVPLPPNGGGATPSSPSGNRKLGNAKMRTPEKPWADMQDSHQDPAGDLAAMGWKSQPSSFQPKHGGSPPPVATGRGKGRKDGKGMDDGKGSRGQQDMQQSGWVPKSEVRQDKGKGQARQEQWTPKSMPAPKAPSPEPLSIASGKGGGRGSMPVVSGGASGGGKKNKRRDAQMEDWLSLRFAGSPPADSSPQESRNEASDWDKSYDAGEDDYDYEDGGGDSRRKRKGSKGGKGKADKRADKGKGKGKSGRGGGVWRSTG